MAVPASRLCEDHLIIPSPDCCRSDAAAFASSGSEALRNVLSALGISHDGTWLNSCRKSIPAGV